MTPITTHPRTSMFFASGHLTKALFVEITHHLDIASIQDLMTVNKVYGEAAKTAYYFRVFIREYPILDSGCNVLTAAPSYWSQELARERGWDISLKTRKLEGTTVLKRNALRGLRTIENSVCVFSTEKTETEIALINEKGKKAASTRVNSTSVSSAFLDQEKNFIYTTRATHIPSSLNMSVSGQVKTFADDKEFGPFSQINKKWLCVPQGLAGVSSNTSHYWVSSVNLSNFRYKNLTNESGDKVFTKVISNIYRDKMILTFDLKSRIIESDLETGQVVRTVTDLSREGIFVTQIEVVRNRFFLGGRVVYAGDLTTGTIRPMEAYEKQSFVSSSRIAIYRGRLFQSSDQGIYVWNAETGKKIRQIQGGSSGIAIAGNSLFSMHWEGTALQKITLSKKENSSSKSGPPVDFKENVSPESSSKKSVKEWVKGIFTSKSKTGR